MSVIGDSDHIGGLFYILENIKVKNVIISYQAKESNNVRKLLNIVKEKKINVIIVNKGDRIKIEEDIFIDVLWPNKDNFILENPLNNNSIVCKIDYGNKSILWTGDIEKSAEKKILEEYKNNKNILKSDILKVAHHGSNTSSTKEFLETVQPKFALIGVGIENKFGHPNKEIIKVLEEKNIKIFRTDIDGEIIVSLSKKDNFIKIKK